MNEIYNIYINKLRKLNELFDETTRSMDKMSRIYQDLTKINENMSILYKDYLDQIQTLNRQWIGSLCTFFSEGIG
jgi:hypothetical protein